MHLGDIPRRNSLRYPEKTAMVFGGKSLTWLQVNQRVNALVHALRGKGLNKGDRIGILMQNRSQFWEIYWALGKAGMIAVPLSYRLTPGELEQLVNHAEITAMIAGEECFDQVEGLRQRTQLIQLFIGIGQVPGYMDDYEALLAAQPVSEPWSDTNENDIFAIFYTSGTTGLPKGAMVSHINLEANCFNQFLADRSQKDDINLTTSPLYHMGAVFMGMTYTYLGCTNYIHQHFDPLEVLETVSRVKITVCLLIPTILNMLLNHPDFDRYDLNSLRIVFYGGGPMPLAVLNRAIEKIGCGFTQGYGLTETLEATFLRSEDHVLNGNEKQRKRLLSAGQEAVGAEVRIIGDDGRDLGAGEVGEVLIKSRSVIHGYWKMPELNREVIEDGWFHTGDLGYLDEERYLFIVDRMKDMIISGGVNIYPKEIEEVFYAHPAVAEAAVIGVPDELWGESVKALVVLRANYQSTEAELIDYCKDRLAGYKKPKSVEFLEELPKNPSGKILKRVLREKYWAGQTRKC